MRRADIERRARIIVVRELPVSPAKVRDGSDFRADLEADSLDMATLTAAIENEFGVKLTDDEACFAQTFGTACDLIEAKMEGHSDRNGRGFPFNRRAG